MTLEQIIEKLRLALDRYVGGPNDEQDTSSLDCLRIEVEGAIDELEKLKTVLGAVTPGPSSRQIIRERIERLANGEVK